MTGVFTVVTPQRCTHYASFMKDLTRREADAIFWILFVITIFLLAIASTAHSKASKTILKNNTLPLSGNNNGKTRLRCFIICLVCFILAIVTVIMEAFAAFSIQFCDGEDLMMLYWGFWSILQVGSVIAIFGIMLHQWYSLKEKEHLPWNVALGTPVVVIATLAYAWHSGVRAVWRKVRGNVGKYKTSDIVSLNRVGSTNPPPGSVQLGFTLNNKPLYGYEMPNSFPTTPGTRNVGLSLSGEPLMVIAEEAPT